MSNVWLLAGVDRAASEPLHGKLVLPSMGLKNYNILIILYAIIDFFFLKSASAGHLTSTVLTFASW